MIQQTTAERDARFRGVMNDQLLQQLDNEAPEVTGAVQAFQPDSIRDEKGRIRPGCTLNPAGKPRGARQKLGEDFAAAMYQDFQQHGIKAIQATRERDPATYVKVIAGMLPKEVEIKRPLEGLSDDELQAAIATLQAMMAGVTIEGEALKVVDNSA